MKKLYYILIAISSVIMSCSDNDELTPNPRFIDKSVVSFSANVNGQNFTSVNSGASIFDGRISIAGISNTGQRLSVLLNKTSTGIYMVNASGSNLLQYEADTSKVNELYSSFLSATPTGTIEILEIDESSKVISGVFNGTASQSSLLVSSNPGNVTITDGIFQNIPFTTPNSTFNFGGMDFKENGVNVSMNTATAAISDGAVNASTYQFINFSTATADFAKSIAIELDDDRYREGLTTYFGAEETDPFSGTAVDSLAAVSYSLNLLGGNPEFYDAISGSITITKIETVNGQENATATFNFVGDDGSGNTINITDGTFSAIFR